jgi:hypothetical protein
MTKTKSQKKRAKQAAKNGQLAQQGGQNKLVQAPSSKQRVRVNPPKAKQSMTPNGNRTVLFEEFVQDIKSGSVANSFTATKFPVQPGIAALFAWLADQAVNYQEYRFRKLAFRYETEQSTGVAGKVMFAFSPDAADATPANKQEMLEYGIKGKSAIWEEFTMPVPMAEALGSRRYIRSGVLAPNLDIKTYDLGALFVATAGVAGGTTCGELYIQYEVELITPVVQSLAQAQARSVTITGVAGITEDFSFGTTNTIVGGLDVAPDPTGKSLQFNRVGNYLVMMELIGTALKTVYAPTGIVAATAGGGANAEFGTVTQIPGISNAAADAGTAARVSFAVTILQRGAFFNPVLGTEGTTITGTVARVATYAL